jgi:hypothetical protein
VPANVIQVAGKTAGATAAVNFDQLATIAADVADLGSGFGPYAVTVAVSDANTSAAIAGAAVKISGGQSAGPILTDGSGHATFSLAAGAVQILVAAPGYGGPAPVAATIAANATITIALTAVAVPSSGIGQATGALVCYDALGNPQAGVTVDLSVYEMPDGDLGHAASQALYSQVSGNTGVLYFTGLWQGSTYRIRRNAGAWKLFAVPTGPSFCINDVLGP